MNPFWPVPEIQLVNVDRYNLYNGTPVNRLELPDPDRFIMAGYRTGEGIKEMRPGKKPGITRIYNQVVNYDDGQRADPDRETGPRKLPHDIDFYLDWNHSGLIAEGPGRRMEKIITVRRKG